MDLLTLGYPNEILPYPAIEYIPLTINNIMDAENWANEHSVKLYIIDSNREQDRVFRMYNISKTEPIDFNNNLLILVTNFKVDDIFYRAHRVQTIGNRRENSYHLFTITKRYFYKNRLIFNLYIPDGKKITKRTYQLIN
ncbi:hypothetical protein [Halonatronum saccharophilum]|uniref:hypothetical protein n=1 Tax=Halonatronum saccharophilum TaxID=150060 RepID=UPI0004819060|nr:hypothetical protein [Halonatronum saccharophilum]